MLIYKIPLKKEEDKEKTEKSTQNIQQTRFQLSAQSKVKEPTIEEDPKNFKKILLTQTSKFLKEQRCINMSMKQFKDREHINKNMCCVEFTEIVHDIEKKIVEKLVEIKSKIQVPFNNAIPLPIYVAIAKVIEKDSNYLLYDKFIRDGKDYSKTFQEKYTFQGKMNIIIYVPNLMNNISDYTYYPSLEVYTNQNKWMELITHPDSYFLRTIDNIKKNNRLFKKISDSICDDYGCIADAEEDINNMLYKTFFLPTKCLQDKNYQKNMDVKVYNIFHNKPWDNGDKELDRKYNELYKKAKEREKNEEGNSEKEEIEEIDEDEDKELKIASLSAALRDEYYFKWTNQTYNKKITDDLQMRYAKSFPGIPEINYKIFKLKPESEIFANTINFHYMPWGDKLINNQYVLNEGKTFHFEDIKYISKKNFQNKIIKFRSLNNKHFMKFNEYGKLSIYDDNSDGKIADVTFLSNIEFSNSTNKYVNFDVSGILYFYSKESEPLSKTIKLPQPNVSLNPYSIILDENNPGNLLIYGMGFNKINY
jgi:hypothetical protein